MEKHIQSMQATTYEEVYDKDEYIAVRDMGKHGGM